MAGMAQMMSKDGFKPMGFIQMAGKRDPDTNRPVLAQGLVEAAIPRSNGGSSQPGREIQQPIAAPSGAPAPTLMGGAGDVNYG